MSDLNKIYRPASFLRSEQEAETVLTIDPQEGKVYRFNDTAAFIWKSMDGTSTLNLIIENLAKEYSAPLTQIKKDAQAFIDYLIENDLIEPVK